MPIREKAVTKLIELFEDKNDPSSARLSDSVIRHIYDKAWVDLVDSIDWNRVKLEASGRCLTVHGDQIKDDIDLACGTCLHAVMLTLETFPDWIFSNKEDK